MTQLQHDWDRPLWRDWLGALAEGRRWVCYHERGSGLSDRDVERSSVDVRVEDLEAAVDEAGLERFSRLGLSNCAADKWRLEQASAHRR
jgi:pimeloyl-ACP methyl ester carboxylesterase